MDILFKFSTPTIGFLGTVVFGFWLSKAGKPYNGILFNIHKLIALGVVIITSMMVYEELNTAPAQGLVIGLVVVAGLAVITLFISGAFLSIGNVRYEVVKLIHNVAPLVAVLMMGSAIYLIFEGIP